MKIAIIGSGLAGLSAAYWLSEDKRNQVTLMDQASRIGLSSHGVDISTLSGAPQTLDVPPRMVGESLWPQLCQLYRQADIALNPIQSSQSFSVQKANDRQKSNDCYLRLSDATRPNVTQLLSTASRAIFRDVQRLTKEGRRDLAVQAAQGITLHDYLRKNQYGESFVYQFLYPTLASTVCTCNFDDLDAYPADLILQSLDSLVTDAKLMRVAGGTQSVSDKLIAAVADIRMGCGVRSIHTIDNGVVVKTADGDAERFDHAILATQANTAAKLWTNIDEQEKKLLGQIQYSTTRVLVHQDTQAMPANQRDWSTFNMLTAPGSRTAACTVWMNRFSEVEDCDRNHFQTIIPDEAEPMAFRYEMDAAEVRLQRPVVTLQSRDVIQQLKDSQQTPNRRVWFAGSWAEYGIPLLESAVVSSRRCVQSIQDHQLAPLTPPIA